MSIFYFMIQKISGNFIFQLYLIYKGQLRDRNRIHISISKPIINAIYMCACLYIMRGTNGKNSLNVQIILDDLSQKVLKQFKFWYLIKKTGGVYSVFTSNLGVELYFIQQWTHGYFLIYTEKKYILYWFTVCPRRKWFTIWSIFSQIQGKAR